MLTLGLLVCCAGALLVAIGLPRVPQKAPLVEPVADAIATSERSVQTAVASRPLVPTNIYIGQPCGKRSRDIHTVLTTRKGGTVYQGFIRYMPQDVPSSEMPGLNDLTSLMQIPQYVKRIDQETEMLINTLGQPTRSVISSHLYVHPVTAHVIAYDLASTSGGQPQRFVGHLTRSGIAVEVFRGAEPVDRHDLPFSARDSFIPVEMEFIHQWYVNNPEALKQSKPVTFSVFIPEVMNFIWLTAAPRSSQVISIAGYTYDCARYEVTTTSTQSAEVLQGRQEMWFDRRSGLLMRREDLDATLAAGDAPMTERATPESLGKLQEYALPTPQLPLRNFPYELDQSLTYTVRLPARGSADNVKQARKTTSEETAGELGRLRIQFSRAVNAQNRPGAYVASASVALEGGEASRHETASTRYDQNWLPISYEASGDEFGKGDAKATYSINATLSDGAIRVKMRREVDTDLAAENAGRPGAATTWTPSAPAAGADWQDPLMRVPISDEDFKAQQRGQNATRMSTHDYSRPLTPGSFLFDFNRIEHLAVLAARLPLPTVPAEGQTPQPAYQKAALYTVRQNRSGVIMFEIRPEPRPVLTPRQKLRQTARDREEPQLFVATVASPLLPCRLLLAPDGRLLELALKYGNNDVVYTLDDPIMRRRAERAHRQKIQEGPQIIRPSWW